MSEIGNSLREARIRKGLSIRDVEGVTKIRSKYLEALEQDDYEVLPGPTFVKAFLRTYATFLKLDGGELVEEYRLRNEPRREEPSVLRAGPVQNARSRATAGRQKRKTRRNQRGYALVGVLAVVAVVLLAWLAPGWGRKDAASLDVGSISSTSSSTSLSEVNSTTTTANETTNSTTSTSLVVATGQNVTLVLTVTQDSCFLVVREDSEAGGQLYAGNLLAGGQKTFDSSKRYWMRVGNPQVLAVSVNGTPLTLGSAAGSFTVTEAGAVANQ